MGRFVHAEARRPGETMEIATGEESESELSIEIPELAPGWFGCVAVHKRENQIGKGTGRLGKVK